MGVGIWLGVIIGVGFVIIGGMRPLCCMIWFIHIMVFCSCSDVVCRFWFDKGVGRTVFVGVELLAKGMLDIIWVEGSRNKVIGNS